MVLENSSGLNVLCFFWIRRTLEKSRFRKKLLHTQDARAENRVLNKRYICLYKGALEACPVGQQAISEMLLDALSAKDPLLSSCPVFLFALFYRNIPRKRDCTAVRGWAW